MRVDSAGGVPKERVGAAHPVFQIPEGVRMAELVRALGA